MKLSQATTWTALVLALFLQTSAAASAADEAVTNFAVTSTLDRASTLDVTEQFDYDFGQTTPHPVTRSIPTTYQDDQGNNYPMTFALLAASRDGQQLHLQPDLKGPVNTLSLPSGSQPVQHFQLHYSLSPVTLRGFTGDVFKLNFTGLGWSVPLQQATVTFSAPGLHADNVTCFTSTTDSTCAMSQNGDSYKITTNAPLLPGDTLSISSGFPKHTFSRYLLTGQSLSAWLPFVIGVLVVLAIPIIIAVILARRSARKAASKTARASSQPASDTPEN